MVNIFSGQIQPECVFLKFQISSCSLNIFVLHLGAPEYIQIVYLFPFIQDLIGLWLVCHIAGSRSPGKSLNTDADVETDTD